MINRSRFLIIINALCFFFSCGEKVTQEVYLIPDHFIGNVIIVYDQSNGRPDSIIDHTAFYKIPKSGILFVKGNQHVRILELMTYYYYDHKGAKRRLCDWMHKGCDNCKGFVYTHRTEWYGLTSDSTQRIYAIIPVGTRDSTPPEFDPAKFYFDKN